MAFYNRNSNPGDMIAADLSASIAKRRDIETRLSRAETKAAECLEAVNDLTRDAADDAAVAAALVAKRASEDLVTAWQTSLADVSEKVLDLQDALKELDDQKMRKETSAAIEAISKRFVDDGTAVDIAIGKFIESTRRIADFVPDARGLEHYLTNAKAEIPLAVTLIAQIAQARAVATVAKTAPAALVMPEQIAPKLKTVPPAPTTARYFLSRNVAWFDAQGGKHCAPSLTDLDLPLHLVTKATEFGAIHAMDSDVRKKNHGGKSQSSKPAFEKCLWLNSDPTAKSNVAPIKSSHLGNPQPMDRGPGYSLIVPSQPLQVATRTEKPRS
jgi:predicted  nucleic acid-binding Zn-ribbon protein